MAVESAISSTGAMLGLRLLEPFSVGGASLPLSSGGSGFWRSMATVPVRDERLSREQRRKVTQKENTINLARRARPFSERSVCSAKTSYNVFTHNVCGIDEVK